MINEFKDDYVFLSNFYPSVIVYDTVHYPTNEHFFQAMKTTDKKVRAFIAGLQYAGQAKKAGRQVHLRPDWEDIKLEVMAFGLMRKFEHPSLRQKLIDTYPHDLVEGNYWNDKIWGYCLKTNEGKNYLGQLLVSLRTILINEDRAAGPDPAF